MNQLPMILLSLMLGFGFCGCVHFSYTGESFASVPGPAPIFNQPEKVPRSYEVLGKAMVYGDYQDVSRDRLEKKLAEEAADRGADAVLITTMQVVPNGSLPTIDAEYRTVQTTGAEYTYSMNELQKDFDGGYGQAFSSKPVTPVIREYRRIIRAEFLRYTGPRADGAAKKSETPAAKPAAKSEAPAKESK